MTKGDEPFWEAAYRDDDADAFGPPSDEFMKIIASFPASTYVLDVGCGEGRNALLMAEKGFEVRAFDISEPAIDKLQRRAKEKNLTVEAWVGRLEDFAFDRDYGLVLTCGVLHFVERDPGDRFLESARAHTVPNGVHAHSVFTDAIEPPQDLAPFIKRLFRDGALRELYADWEIEFFESYIKEDEHEGGLRHRHSINTLFARKPKNQI